MVDFVSRVLFGVDYLIINEKVSNGYGIFIKKDMVVLLEMRWVWEKPYRLASEFSVQIISHCLLCWFCLFISFGRYSFYRYYLVTSYV